jgi:hypothetical protein
VTVTPPVVVCPPAGLGDEMLDSECLRARIRRAFLFLRTHDLFEVRGFRLTARHLGLRGRLSTLAGTFHVERLLNVVIGDGTPAGRDG